MKLSRLSLADYNQLDSIPVINQDLSASGFTPTANTYYRHTGATTDTFTQGIIYLYDTAYHKLGESGGTTYHKLGESGGTTLNKYVYTFSGNDFARLRRIVDNAKGNINIAFVYNDWLWYGSLSFWRPNNQASYIVLSGIAIKADDATSTDVMYVVADTGNNGIFTITDIGGTKTRTKVTSGFKFYVCYYNDTEIT